MVNGRNYGTVSRVIPTCSTAVVPVGHTCLAVDAYALDVLLRTTMSENVRIVLFSY